MKTNVVMIRHLSQFEVSQRTKDGMFNATELLKQWNTSTGMKKDIKDFLANQGTKDFLEVLTNEENIKGGNYPYLGTRGKHGATWMHPILFIKFAMWINPKFEYFVIKFVYDQLIQFRHSAGDNYKGLTSAVSRFENVNYSQLAKGLNYIVFGKHEDGLRQNATEAQLKELTELQQKLAFTIDMGYIKSYDELINEIRRLWYMKYNNRLTA